MEECWALGESCQGKGVVAVCSQERCCTSCLYESSWSSWVLEILREFKSSDGCLKNRKELSALDSKKIIVLVSSGLRICGGTFK